MAAKPTAPGAPDTSLTSKHVAVDIVDGIAWVTLNRPDKRNAMNPALNDEMVVILDTLEDDDRCDVLVLTGAGDSFSSGMDLKEYFRATDGLPPLKQQRARRSAAQWQWRQLSNFPKPTIAMVNGWCFGGALTPLVSCDLAIAAEEAVFGISEINWGIMPSGNVTRAVAQTMRHRDAMYYIMTGETFDGRKAAEMGLVNEAVPLAKLRERTTALAKVLQSKSPAALRAGKAALRMVQGMPWEQSNEYLTSKASQLRLFDEEGGREKGMKQFLDDKTYRPGLEGYRRKD
ncbi:MAG: p-hydroxycinnamoyl CoA hydratase/lyase [Pseudomonadota bacterium]